MVATFFMLLSGLQEPHMTKYVTHVSYVRQHFGLNTVVVFDGYESSNSTKAAEQQCLVVARLVVTKHVDAGNSDYIARLCAVSVKVELVKTLQLLATHPT